MRLSSGLLVAGAGAGLLSVAAALLALMGTSLRFGLVTLLALLGHVLLSAAAPRVRWAVAAGLGLLAVVTVVRLFWLQEQPQHTSWPYGPEAVRTSLLANWRTAIDRERLAALGGLCGVLCLVAGVTALPARGRRLAVATSVLALVLLAWFGLEFVRESGRHPLAGLLGVVWPALLAVLVTVGALALSGWRADRRWLLPVGLLLLSLAAARACVDLAGSWSGWWLLSRPAEGSLLEVGVSMSTTAEGFPHVSRAVSAALALAGPALVAVGALRSSREADAS